MAKLDDWNDVKSKQKPDLKNAHRAWYELKKTEVDFYHGFDFEITDYKTDGMIYLSFVLFLPFLTSIVAFAAFPEVASVTLQLITSIVTFISGLIGFVISFNRLREKFWNEGFAFGYLFIIVPYLGVIIGSFILATFNKDNSDTSSVPTLSSFFSLGCQTVAEILVIVFFFSKSNDASGMFIGTFNKSKILLLIVVPIGFLALFLISELIFGEAYSKIFHITDDSENQKQLLSLLHSDNKVIKYSYIILLFISSIMVAPLCEEMCTRYSFFGNVGNKWIGLATASLYFGFIHCGQAGDFIHLPTYIAAGFTLSSVFIVVRGNYTYTWLIHLLNNLVSLIIILATL